MVALDPTLLPLVLGLTIAQTAVEATRPAEAPLDADIRIDATQLVAGDSFTDRRLIYTDLRGVVDASIAAGRPLSLHGDVLGRIGYNDVSPSRYDISRLYLEYGESTDWAIAAGRINIDSVNAAQVDGARFALGVGEGATVSAFAGLMPHPILRTFNTDFMTAGAAYDVFRKNVNHGGGVAVQLYQGELDRAMIAERIYLRFGPAFSLYARGVLDVITQSGFLGDLAGVAAEEQSALQKIDLSQAFATLRVRPSPVVDVSFSASHMHALLPNTWWADWVEQERARRGFTLDGPLPVGSRRTTGRAVVNVHVDDFTPYLSGRYDRRHEDGANGFAGTAGVKYNNRSFGYVDVHATHRNYFDAEHQLVGAQLGIDIVEGLTFDAGGGALRLDTADADAQWMFDANGTVFLDLGTVFEPLRRAHLLAMYQAFVEPQIVYQLFLLRVGYRLDI